MENLILELQKEISNQECDIISILRKAHIIAFKLNMSDFDNWIYNELNGYYNKIEIPEYRKIKGELIADHPLRGWDTVLIQDPTLEARISESEIKQPIFEIIDKCNSSNGYIILGFDDSVTKVLNDMLNSPPMKRFGVQISKSRLQEVIEKVKNTILDWTLKLQENGTLESDMTVTQREKLQAQTINNYYVNSNIVNSPTNNCQIISGDNNKVIFDYKQASNDIKTIKEKINNSDLSHENKLQINNVLDEIDSTIDHNDKPDVIKKLFAKLIDLINKLGLKFLLIFIEEVIKNLF
ncbi:MAG: hypothetical protein WBO70_01390 [Erysipelotrichaceae bacterium]